MNYLTAWTALIGEIAALIAILTPLLIQQSKVKRGQRCQLRSEILRIYYKNCNARTIHQYEYENVVLLYEAYKALKGNSFIDKIYSEIQDWKVIH